MKTPRALLLVLPSALVFANPVFAVTKDDNTTNLNLAGAWAGGIAPTSADIAEWSGAYGTAGSLSATFTASSPVSWQGITIGNITGTAAGTVSIGGTGSSVSGSSVTIGSSGIDMSGANQNLVINSATTVLAGATQTWNVATGRNLRFGSTGTGGANANLDGSASTVITVTGGGLVDANQGGATGFSDAAGYAGFNGKWIVDANTTLRGIRNGATAWGTGTAADTIKLNGGTLATGGISGAVGNWTWNTNIQVAAASIIDNQNASGSGRYLKLNGILDGGSALTFASTGAGTMSADSGFILTGANTLSGTVTINPGVFVRLGGINGTGGTNTSTSVGSTGDLGTASVVNNGTLTLSRDNTWTFANQVSGSGILRIGITSGSASHIVTVSGDNSHSGGTTLQSAVTLRIGHANALGSGPFTIAGNGVFDNATGGSLSLSNTLALTGGSPTFTGTDEITFGGLATIAAANRTLTVNGSTLTLAGGTTEDTAGRNLTKAGAGTLVLSGTGGHTGTTTVNAGTLILSGGSALTDSSPVVLANTAGVTLQLNSSETIGNLTGGGATGGTVAVGSNTLTINTTTGVQVLGAAVTGTGSIVKDGVGELTLTGTNTFSGTYTVNSNALAFRGVDSENGSPAIILGPSGSLALGSGFVGQSATISSLSGSGIVTAQFDSNTGTKTLEVNQSSDTVFSGILRDTTDTSDRVLALSKAGTGSLTLSGDNTYTGGTTVSGGTLVAGSNTAFGGVAGTVTVNAGGTLNLNGFSIGNTVTNNGGTIVGAAGNATIAQNGGTLSGSVGGNITASGTVAGSATITGTLKGTATFTGAITIGSTGIHAPGNSPGIETFSAGISYDAGSTLEWEFAGDTLALRGTDFDGVDVTDGALTITAGALLKVINLSAVDYAATDWDTVRNFTIVDNSGSGTTSGDFTLDPTGDTLIPGEGSWSVLTTAGAGGDTVLTWTPVPEPSTYAALAGLLALGLALRRRSR